MSEHDLYALIREHIPERYQDDYRIAVREAIRLRHAEDGDEIDTDDGNGIGFGDRGMLYCFIDPEDLAAADLAAAVAYSESH